MEADKRIRVQAQNDRHERTDQDGRQHPPGSVGRAAGPASPSFLKKAL